MHIGHYISGSAHIGLLGWMLLGGVFQSEQLPVDVSNVSVVSLSEYADIVMTDRAPEAELQPQDLMQPETEADPLPERPSQEQAVENIPQPELMVQVKKLELTQDSSHLQKTSSNMEFLLEAALPLVPVKQLP